MLYNFIILLYNSNKNDFYCNKSTMVKPVAGLFPIDRRFGN